MKNTTSDFSKLNLYVGIDVHKKQWSVSIFTDAAHHRTFSQAPFPLTLKTYLDNHFPQANVVCAYEAGKFGFWIARQLGAYGYQCMVVNAADIPASNKELTEKADPNDSRKIAKALRAGLISSIHVPDQHTEGHRQLFRYRKRLQQDIIRIKNRIKDKFIFTGTAIPPEFDNSNWSKAFLRWLKEVELPDAFTRKTLDLLLEQFHFIYRHFLNASIEVRRLQRHERYKTDAKLLRSIPGIGPLTTVQLLTEIEDINRFPNFRHFNGFVGFKPSTHSSGDSIRRGSLTTRQNKLLRSALIECAWTTISVDPAMLLKYESLKKRMNGKRAIVVIARKLLSRIWFVLRNKQPYVIGLA